MLYARTFSEIGLDADGLEDRASIDRPEPMSAREIAEHYWWELHDRGASIRQIAAMVDVSPPTVFRGIRAERIRRENAKNDLPGVTPLLGTPGHRPGMPCPHQADILRGERRYCDSCAKSGIDHLPGLKIAPNDPLLTQRKKPGSKSGKGRTRKERRRLAASA